jgi:hypothetical protein
MLYPYLLYSSQTGVEKMGDSSLLYEVAKLHRRDVDREIALMQVAKQAKAAKPGLAKRFENVSKSVLKKLVA